jgi:hypothetical protein
VRNQLLTLEDPEEGPIQVAGFQGPPPPDLNAMVDSKVQLAAKEAVVTTGTPTALVAIQPSTGGVLAADVNNWAMELGPVATHGMYPAGGTLDPVRLAAGLDKGIDGADVSSEDLAETARRLGLGLDVSVPGFDFETSQIGNTRSAAAVELWQDELDGAVVAIGNAPTALFRLLEMLDAGWPKPALILGFPVGFVGAAESKAELAANARGCEFLTLKGRRGGSAMAAAAVNALVQK